MGNVSARVRAVDHLGQPAACLSASAVAHVQTVGLRLRLRLRLRGGRGFGAARHGAVPLLGASHVLRVLASCDLARVRRCRPVVVREYVHHPLVFAQTVQAAQSGGEVRTRLQCGGEDRPRVAIVVRVLDADGARVGVPVAARQHGIRIVHELTDSAVLVDLIMSRSLGVAPHIVAVVNAKVACVVVQRDAEDALLSTSGIRTQQDLINVGNAVVPIYFKTLLSRGWIRSSLVLDRARALEPLRCD